MSSVNSSSFNPTETKRWIESEIAEQQMAGCAIGVELHGHTVLYEYFGSRNEKGDPVTPGTRFWIASMTKPIVSVVALQLIESGKMSLQDPVSSFIAEFGNAGVINNEGDIVAVSRPPTILDLLTHTSGLTYGQFGTDDIHQRYSKAGVFDYFSDNQKMAVRLARLPLLHQPDTAFEYGMSTDVLGRIIEMVTGLSLDLALSRSVFEPLGMTDTNFAPDNAAHLASSVIQEAIAPDFKRKPSWFSAPARAKQ